MAHHMEQAFDALDAGAQVVAGGTDWFPARGDHVAEVPILDITQLSGFAGITASAGGWRIGAATSWSDIISADLPPVFNALKAAAGVVGSVQIQNVGTVAGNLCNASPAADGVPPLLALGAQVECVSRNARRQLPLAAFLQGPRQTALQPGELVRAIHVPAQPVDAVSCWAKLGSREYLVISIAMIAVQAVVRGGRVSDLRIAVGSCGPVARRLHGLEARLEGAYAPARIEPRDLAELSPIDDMRGTAAYRRDVVATEITRLLAEVVR